MVEKQLRQRAHAARLDFVPIATQPIATSVIEKIDFPRARAAACLPFAQNNSGLSVAVAEPASPATQNFLQTLKKLTPKIYLANRADILNRLSALAQQQPKPKPNKNLSFTGGPTKKLPDLQNSLTKLSAKAALQQILLGALQLKASDLHFQFEETKFLIRTRVDGVLLKVLEFDSKFGTELLTQLKYEAKLSLNVREIPQDGRLTFATPAGQVDVRIATFPSIFGETAVCRLLNRQQKILSLAELGFRNQTLAHLEATQNFTEGLILVTGPTGSGKTTTLYTLLQHLNSPTKKTLTLEDPVEYHLAGIVQSQIDPAHDFSFARGLRALLRQDPDTLMIGEIRDNETAVTTASAALTGHTVLTTLHTNSALDTLIRLQHLGLPNFILAASLKLVVSQRLVRKPCPHCQAKTPLTAKQRQFFAKFQIPAPELLVVARGCKDCHESGYLGRIALAESFRVGKLLRNFILQNAELAQLQEAARASGLSSLTLDGLQKAARGLTTLAELTRVLGLPVLS